jgi:hypothetical protein
MAMAVLQSAAGPGAERAAQSSAVVTEAFFGTLLVLGYCALRPNAPERARRGSEIVG